MIFLRVGDGQKIDTVFNELFCIIGDYYVIIRYFITNYDQFDDLFPPLNKK